jgi:hypothetical protein
MPPEQREMAMEDDWGIVTAWNDEPGRRQEEVLALVDSAIARLKRCREEVT